MEGITFDKRRQFWRNEEAVKSLLLSSLITDIDEGTRTEINMNDMITKNGINIVSMTMNPIHSQRAYFVVQCVFGSEQQALALMNALINDTSSLFLMNRNSIRIPADDIGNTIVPENLPLSINKVHRNAEISLAATTRSGYYGIRTAQIHLNGLQLAHGVNDVVKCEMEFHIPHYGATFRTDLFGKFVVDTSLDSQSMGVSLADYSELEKCFKEIVTPEGQPHITWLLKKTESVPSLLQREGGPQCFTIECAEAIWADSPPIDKWELKLEISSFSGSALIVNAIYHRDLIQKCYFKALTMRYSDTNTANKIPVGWFPVVEGTSSATRLWKRIYLNKGIDQRYMRIYDCINETDTECATRSSARFINADDMSKDFLEGTYNLDFGNILDATKRAEELSDPFESLPFVLGDIVPDDWKSFVCTLENSQGMATQLVESEVDMYTFSDFGDPEWNTLQRNANQLSMLVDARNARFKVGGAWLLPHPINPMKPLR